nr:DNA polymerase I [Synergistales bacterium]
MAKQKLLLVDGHALAFRAFYALPELNAPDGTPTNAVLGFVNMLLKVLNDEKPTHVAVVFDAKGETFRHQAYREYKAGRQPAPDAFKIQLPLIKELVALLGLPLLEIEGVEADDVIASAALRAASSGVEASILTADKDLMQILAPGIQVIKPSKGVSDFKVYDAETFIEEYG